MKKLILIFVIMFSFTAAQLYSESGNGLNDLRNLSEPVVSINNIEIDKDSAQALLEKMKEAEKNTVCKLRCPFLITIEANGETLKIKSDGGTMFAFSGTSMFYQMDSVLTDFVPLERISLVYGGEKYLITPVGNQAVRVETEWNQKDIKLSDSEYRMLFSADKARGVDEVSKYVADSYAYLYYKNGIKVILKVQEDERGTFSAVLEKLVGVFNGE